MEQKFIVVVTRRKCHRAVTIKKDSVEAARRHVESMMRVNAWLDAELYENDCITPAMDDGYVLNSSAHYNMNGEIKWKIFKLKPSAIRR